MLRPLGFTLCMLFVAGTVDATGRFAARGIHANPNGGVTAGHAGGFRGPDGAAGVHGRRTTSDGLGNVTSNARSAWRGPNGGTATSQGSASRNADGTGSFDRTTQAHGANGGSYNGSTTGATGQGITHDTDATGRNGNTYTGSTTVTKDGVSHSGTCADASGQPIPCR
ncbi:hypothetical protein [Luteibacter aegosomatissinici]|uniref:hypothetical protein n=1 Tax=Luteibacter aegosomatissinici TaxID=2911539 RepID=UPI001FF810AF|nr:hypothetical protein [Luteibacter aegosomatissinici]UPG94619.1 hypothetical protein L2Y97_00515 [Luteibacter aegosomatissinici]